METVSLLTPEEASKLLKVSTQTLANWRSAGTGPRPQKIGHLVRYRKSDLIAWLDEQQAKNATGG